MAFIDKINPDVPEEAFDLEWGIHPQVSCLF